MSKEITKKVLEELYVKKNLPLSTIAEKFNCSITKIKNALDRYNISMADNSSIQEKIYNTKKSHNSFNTSKPEEEIYKLLIQKFPKTKSQYRSNLYPWPCDFYIPEIDTYIELNFYWCHGYEPFNRRKIAHRKLVEQWTQKSKELDSQGNPKTQFAYAVKTWTEKDPLKRETARRNNLKYLEFFNIKEFMEWYNNVRHSKKHFLWF